VADVPSIGMGGARRISPETADGGADETRRARVLDECAAKSASASVYRVLCVCSDPLFLPR